MIHVIGLNNKFNNKLKTKITTAITKNNLINWHFFTPI